MKDTMTPPGEVSDTTSTIISSEGPSEAISGTPRDTELGVEPTQEPPQGTKRKASEEDECAETTPTAPKKRKVTFNTDIYVSSEANIDILRQQYSSKAAADESIKHTIRPLKGTRRGLRSLCWRTSSRYSPGDWAIANGSENVNTSGCGSKKNFDRYAGLGDPFDEELWKAKQKEWDAWDQYVEALDAKGKKMDGWSEMMRDPRCFLVAEPERFLQQEDLAATGLGRLAMAPGLHLLTNSLLWQFMGRSS